MGKLFSKSILVFALVLIVANVADGSDHGASSLSSFNLNNTGQTTCYDSGGGVISCSSSSFPGQDGQYSTGAMSFQDNGDGTITDLNTGLMWSQSPIEKVSYSDANNNASSQTTGGYTDWRVPSIKELYSLIDFSGSTGMSANDAVPYIDTSYFVFSYGDTSAGYRYMDAQYWTTTEYVSTTMNGDATVFGVNFADGRIKGYPRDALATSISGLHNIRYVRGSTYGVNNFADNGNQTVTDQATGLVWQKNDDGVTRNWQEALAYCENMVLAGASDWRLPNAKELQGIVDYTRSPDTSGSAAIDPVFGASSFIDGNGLQDYGYFWTSTTHLDGANPGDFAVYIAFGEALGYMETSPNSGSYALLDVHGAGAQRSDPKTGDPDDYPNGHGPQGDVIGIYNYARCVRGGV